MSRGRTDEFGEAFGPGPVGVAAGEVGEHAAGFGEADFSADTDGLVAKGLGDVTFPDADRPVDDDRLAGVQPAQGGEVADRGGGQFRAGGEVELLQGDGLVEASSTEPSADGGGVASGDLVVAEDLQELEVTEFPGAGLGEAGVEVCSIPDSFSVRRLSCSAVSSTLMASSPGRSG